MTISPSQGDRVRVKSAAEIIATLDEHGTLEGLPFMPEMLQYCGQEFRVAATAHKTCDTVHKTGGRSLPRTVHLSNSRCSGAAHGGCDAYCLLFWKEAWLEPVDRAQAPMDGARGTYINRLPTTRDASGETAYCCQATELPKFTQPLRWWDVRQYIADVRGGNHSIVDMIKLGALKCVHNLAELGVGYRFFIQVYNILQSHLGGVPRSYIERGLVAPGQRTPTTQLGLKPGDLIEVKSFEEIRQTLDADDKNRGMRFDIEMRPYCGKQFRVAKRVERIINELTGEMIQMKTVGIILDGAFCGAKFSRYRMFCPRALPGFWREVWLRRINETAIQVVSVNR